MNPIADNVIRIPTSLDSSFFRLWVRFLSPYHNMTEREIDVFTCFLKYRYNLSKEISNDDILDRVLMSDDTRRTIRDELNIKPDNFHVIMGKLKKKKLIVNGIINRKFVPSLRKDAEDYKLMLYFEL